MTLTGGGDFGGRRYKREATPLPSRLRDPHGNRSRKILRARGGGRLQGNSIYQIQQGRYTNELIGTVTAGTRHTYTKAS